MKIKKGVIYADCLFIAEKANVEQVSIVATVAMDADEGQIIHNLSLI